MLMTEQEARTKWCPHYRQYQGEDGTGDNRPNGGFNPRCIASDCMAWRFADDKPVYEIRHVSDDRFADRYKEAYALPDDQADAALDALDAERMAFADSWQPEAPEPGMEMGKVSFSDSKVVATFRRLVRDRRGYCGAFARPEG